ncbi:hypothetical protein D6C95_01854 [Aureobasidium pullulans]|nr:hypothetical protein D6C95_01854 [Aureobasidium pullulans]
MKGWSSLDLIASLRDCDFGSDVVTNEGFRLQQSGKILDELKDRWCQVDEVMNRWHQKHIYRVSNGQKGVRGIVDDEAVVPTLAGCCGAPISRPHILFASYRSAICTVISTRRSYPASPACAPHRSNPRSSPISQSYRRLSFATIILAVFPQQARQRIPFFAFRIRSLPLAQTSLFQSSTSS